MINRIHATYATLAAVSLLALAACASGPPQEWRHTPAALAAATQGSPDETYAQADAACNLDAERTSAAVRGFGESIGAHIVVYQRCMAVRGFELVPKVSAPSS